MTWFEASVADLGAERETFQGETALLGARVRDHTTQATALLYALAMRKAVALGSASMEA